MRSFACCLRLRRVVESRTRQLGIDVLGALPWGEHLSYFYNTRQDLVDVLVPYFKAGLENNESCLWITPEFLSEEEAEEAMRKAIPDFSQYLASGQMEIIPHTEWYLKGGTFILQRVQNAWAGKLKRALTSGYDGLRVSGDTTWLGKKDWSKFIDYEEAINKTIGKSSVIALCTYPLHKCVASQTINLIRNHQYNLIKHKGSLTFIGGTKHKQVEEEIQKKFLRSKSGSLLTELQESFIREGFKDLSENAYIRLIFNLCRYNPECDKKIEKCVEHFKSVRALLSADDQELQQIGVCPRGLFTIKLLRELPAEVLKQKIVERSFYKSSKEVFDYLYYSMRDLKKEIFKVIYLNNRSQIIDTTDLFEGSANSIPIRPREIVESAITHRAAGLIFVHNHPTGDPNPSRTDKQLTRDLVFVGKILQIGILDHIIIGENSYFSFADDGLVQKYEDNFLNLKIRGVLSSIPLYQHYSHLPKGLHHQHQVNPLLCYQLSFPDREKTSSSPVPR